MRSAVAFLLVLLSSSVVHAAITGTIVTDEGAPIAGASIRAFAAESSRNLRQRLLSAKPERDPIASASSGEDGVFRLDANDSIALDLVITAPGRLTLEWQAVAGQELGSIILPAASPRTLRVTANGKPLAGALIQIGRALSIRTDAVGLATTTTNFGEITVVHPDEAIRTFSPRGASSSEIALTPGVEIRGRVVNGQSPVPGATILISGWPMAKTGEDGTFVVLHAPDSWRAIQAVAGDRVAERLRSQSGAVELRRARIRARLRRQPGHDKRAGRGPAHRAHQSSAPADPFSDCRTSASGCSRLARSGVERDAGRRQQRAVLQPQARRLSARAGWSKWSGLEERASEPGLRGHHRCGSVRHWGS